MKLGACKEKDVKSREKLYPREILLGWGKGVNSVAAGQKTNQLLVPAARAAMEQFKWETAAELGIQVPQGGYMGDLPSRVNGAIGGNMIRKMIQSYEQSLTGTTTGNTGNV